MKDFFVGSLIGCAVLLTLICTAVIFDRVQKKPTPPFSTPCIHDLVFIFDGGYLTQVVDENGKGVRCN